MADLGARGMQAPSVKFFSISCSFRQKLFQIIQDPPLPLLHSYACRCKMAQYQPVAHRAMTVEGVRYLCCYLLPLPIPKFQNKMSLLVQLQFDRRDQ